jgi:polyferredoxin
LAREVEDGLIENIYTLRLMNADEAAHRYAVSVAGLPGISLKGEKVFDVAPASVQTVMVSVRTTPEAGTKGSNTIYFNVTAESQDKISVQEKASFMLP